LINVLVISRWILKKLQIDFNELMSRNAIGSKILKDIKVHHLEMGNRAPIIKAVTVQNVALSSDQSFFDVLLS